MQYNYFRNCQEELSCLWHDNKYIPNIGFLKVPIFNKLSRIKKMLSELCADTIIIIMMPKAS